MQEMRRQCETSPKRKRDQMENTVLVALSQQMVLRRQMDVIANNIANASTIGFKSERMLFSEYLSDIGDGQQLAFVTDAAVVHDPSEGALTPTGNPLDVALKGPGYFEVDTPDGVRYTRGGHFRIDADGVLVTADGYPLLDQGGSPILTLPGDIEITIKADGTINSESGEIGQLDVVNFENRSMLRKFGAGMYEAPENVLPIPAVEADVIQGSVEESNVAPIIEMTRMISLLRSYQGAQQLADEQDRLVRQSIDVLANTQNA
jgi:flagellar basal-body rod protein FlgF